MNRIRKAIIPAAGLGTRFLPATKSIPKEMLPIVDKPILLYVVEEAVRAGIEDIVLIAGRGKSAIENFFDASYELEDHLGKTGKTELFDRLRDIKSMANIISVRQKDSLGLGHAVLCGQSVIGSESFAVLLGDEIMISKENEPTCIGGLAQHAEKTGLSTVSIMEVPEQDVSKYGIVGGELLENNLFNITSVIEKPSLSEAPSRWALPGRYIFNASLFEYLKNASPGKNGEYQLTDGMIKEAQDHGLHGLPVTARRYDAGDKLGFIQANIELALERDDLGAALKEYIKKLAKEV